MPARAISSGVVSFGLVAIPVMVYSCTESASAVRFHMINPETGSRVKQQLVDGSTGEVVERASLGKGYEVSKGQYVVLTEDEYKALLEVGSHAIEIVEFVPLEAVPPLFYDRSYYLGTDKGGERAYHLLRAAMDETGLVGIARYSARGRQYLVMLRPHDGRGLVMQQLHYVDEIKPFEELPIADAPATSDEELALAVQVIEQSAHQTFEPGKYQDSVKKRILALIDEKIAGKEIQPAPEEAPQAQVIDLMDALKKSLAEGVAAEGKGAGLKRKPARAARSGASTRAGTKKRGASASRSKKKPRGA